MSPALRASALALFLCACGDADGTPRPSDRSAVTAPPREVRLAAARVEPWERSVAATGELAADERVVLAAKVAGRVQELTVDLGATVKREQVLARLESRDFELRVELAEAAVTAARA